VRPWGTCGERSRCLQCETIRHSSAALLLIVALCAIAPISVVVAKVGKFSGEDFLRHCTTSKPDQPPKNTEEQEMAVYCVGYIEGAITAILAQDGQSFCIPQNTTPADVIGKTFTFMQDHPEQQQDRLAGVMLAAVKDQWPCKTK
jgi:hypothetical protein